MKAAIDHSPFLISGITAAFLIWASPLPAATTYTATLAGNQVVPSVSTSASGTAAITLNQPAGPSGPSVIDFQVSFTGISSGWTTARLYGPAAVGQIGAQLFDFDADNSPFDPLPGTTSGTLNGMDNSISDSLKNALASGVVYIEIRSNAFPGGEIRGQLTAVPEPSTYFLLGTFAFGLAFSRKRSA